MGRSSVTNLDVSSAAGYLSQRTGIPATSWTIRNLGGGVSNEVLLAEAPGIRWVVKQALPKLRVQEEWLADPQRIHRECAALRLLGGVLPPDAVPAVVFEDRDNFIFAMEAAPVAARDWKSLLLSGDCQERHAGQVAQLFRAQLAWQGDPVAFRDQHCFDQLRLDPYYRFTATRHPDLRPYFEACIDACRTDARALVHGDYSPKNMLVCGDRIVLIDCEVIHWGDPNFDSAFLLNHLLLKVAHGIEGCRRLALTFWEGVRDIVDETATLRHLGCLHLTRVDGKSPAEYLTDRERELVRRQARELIQHPPGAMEDLFR